MKKLTNRGITLILVFLLFAGLSLLLYPTVANWWNLNYASRVAQSYSEEISAMEDTKLTRMWEEAEKYNQVMISQGQNLWLADNQQKLYWKMLDPTNTSMLGTVEIDKLGVELPIYHGTDESVLQTGIGHIEWTSLPTGGESTHCVLSGHRGLPSAKLFTDIDKMREGDIFRLKVLGKTLTYQVDRIRIVLPEEIDYLRIVKGKDLCTLVTCTPYGINTHRLLVRGHRVSNVLGDGIPNEAIKMTPVIVAVIAGCILGIIAFLAMMLNEPLKGRKTDKEYAAYEK